MLCFKVHQAKQTVVSRKATQFSTTTTTTAATTQTYLSQRCHAGRMQTILNPIKLSEYPMLFRKKVENVPQLCVSIITFDLTKNARPLDELCPCPDCKKCAAEGVFSTQQQHQQEQQQQQQQQQHNKVRTEISSTEGLSMASGRPTCLFSC